MPDDPRTTLNDTTADLLDEAQPAVVPATPVGPPKLRPYQVALVNDLYRELNVATNEWPLLLARAQGRPLSAGRFVRMPKRQASG